MTEPVYQENIRKLPKRTQPHPGVCKQCGIGVPVAPARYCPTCIQRAARLFEAYVAAGEAHRFHMGRLHVACYEWREVIEVAV